MNNNNNAVIQTTKPNFLHMIEDSSGLKIKKKEKSTPQQKLAARRAIEQHFEKKRLKSDIEDYWFDS